jgi:hypothetical protein
MINLKVLGTAAAIALVLPMAGAVQAQERGSMAGGGGGGGGARAGGGGGGGAAIGGGGGGFRGGGGGAMGGGGGGFRSGAVNSPSMGGAPSGFRQAPTMGFRATPGSGGSPGMERGSEANRFVAGGGTIGQGPGNYGRGRYGYGGGYRHRGGGFWPGVAVGVGVGSTYGYYGNSYYGSPYYDDSYGYYDDTTVAAGPSADGDSVAYCSQRYKSYDPASGTYLGYDGQRHPCPAE